MKNIVAVSAMALLFFSCTNLQQDSYSSKEIVLPLRNPNLVQENFSMTSNNTNQLYNLIQNEFNTGGFRNYSVSDLKAPLEIYAGETLKISNIGANRIKLISSPVKSDFNLSVNNGTLTFKSLYQGSYVAEIYNDFTYIGTVKIINKLKYNFTERNNYDIILDSYKNRNLDTLLKSSEIYTYAFPNNSKQKDVTFMTLELCSSSNQFLVNNKIKYLKDNFTLTEKEKIKLLNFEIGSNNLKSIDNYYLDYSKNNIELNREIVKIIKTKNSANVEELQFLEHFYSDVQESDLAYTIGSLYSKIGNSVKANYYLSLGGSAVTATTESLENSFLSSFKDSSIFSSSNSEKSSSSSTNLKGNDSLSNGIDALNRKSYNEAIIFLNKALSTSKNNEAYFYRGKTYFMMNNYQKALNDFNSISNPTSNLEELYYYMGVSYHKTGNLDKAREFLRKSRETNSSSTWGRKSSIYLLKL